MCSFSILITDITDSDAQWTLMTSAQCPYQCRWPLTPMSPEHCVHRISVHWNTDDLSALTMSVTQWYTDIGVHWHRCILTSMSFLFYYNSFLIKQDILRTDILLQKNLSTEWASYRGCFISFEVRQDDYFRHIENSVWPICFISIWSIRHGLSNDILLINILFCISKNISIRMYPSRTSCLPFLIQTVVKNVSIAHDFLSIEKRLYACMESCKNSEKSCTWRTMQAYKRFSMERKSCAMDTFLTTVWIKNERQEVRLG
jgi:hypothetical protein